MTRRTAQLGPGLAALGRPGYITRGHALDLEGDYDPKEMERRCHAVLDAAWAEGVRWFDAARSYGRAAEFLASWPRARSPRRCHGVVEVGLHRYGATGGVVDALRRRSGRMPPLWVLSAHDPSGHPRRMKWARL